MAVEEERVGVEDIVAHELPGVAVEILLAALGDEGGAGDLRAVDGVVLRGVDLEFGDGVGIGHRAGRKRAVETVGAGAGVAVHVDAARAAAEGSGIVDVGGGTRGHGQHLREVAGGERDRGDGLGIDQDAGGRGHGADAALALGLVGGFAGLQGGVERGRFRDADDHGRHARGLESGGREAGLVGARGEQAETIAAVGTGGGGLDLVGGRVRERDGDIGQGVARRIAHRAGEGAGGG